MTKTYHIGLDPSLGDPAKEYSQAWAVKYAWGILSSIFDINVSYSRGSKGWSIVYRWQKSQYTAEASLARVTLRDNTSNPRYTPESVSMATLMHETFHGIGYGHRTELGALTVRGRPLRGPLLRLNDFLTLSKKFGLKEQGAPLPGTPASKPGVPFDKTFTVDLSTGALLVNGQVNQDFRILSPSKLPLVYGILYAKSGHNVLDFSNLTVNITSDLRPSVLLMKDGKKLSDTVDPKQIYGTRIGSATRVLGVGNLVNAPDVVLFDFKGGSGDDAATGNALDNNLSGNAGNDTLRGLAGRDTLNGDAGNDTADYSWDAQAGGTGGVRVNLAGDVWIIDRLDSTKNVGPHSARDGFGDIDTLVSIENVIGTAYDDWLRGDKAANVLNGLAGNDVLSGEDGPDVLIGGAGDDTLLGGFGRDTADYSSDAAAGGKRGVIVNLAANPLALNHDQFLAAGSALDGFGDTDTLISIENIVGTQFADLMNGDNGGNFFNGGAGDDSLYGNGGNDRLMGGKGADLLDGGSGSDWVDYSSDAAAGGTKGIIVNLSDLEWTLPSYPKIRISAKTARDGFGEYDRLVSIENVIGTGSADVILGNDIANSVRAGGGDDLVYGGGGHDYLSGEEGNDQLFGDDGNDRLLGGEGNDTLDGGSGIDTADYSLDAKQGGLSGIVVNLSDDRVMVGQRTVNAHEVVDGFGTFDTLKSIENVVGTSFADIIIGDDGDNQFLAGAGDDTLYGGKGRDLIRGGVGNDVIYGGDDNDRLFGDAGDDVLDGGDGDDVLAAGDGNDSLIGGAGNDRLAGQAGDDILTGGTGADVFCFRWNYGHDVVTDFNAGEGDKLEIDKRWTGGMSFAEFMQRYGSQQGDSVVFTFDETTSLTLNHVTLSALTKQDFTFR